LLGRCVVVRGDMNSDGFKWNHSVLAKEVAVCSRRSDRIGHGDGKDRVPTPDLGFLENQVQEELEVSSVSEIERLCAQRFGGALEMLRSSRGG
jgi:hypothetical protein